MTTSTKALRRLGAPLCQAGCGKLGSLLRVTIRTDGVASLSTEADFNMPLCSDEKCHQQIVGGTANFATDGTLRIAPRGGMALIVGVVQDAED